MGEPAVRLQRRQPAPPPPVPGPRPRPTTVRTSSESGGTVQMTSAPSAAAAGPLTVRHAAGSAAGATLVDGLRLPVMREGPLRCADGPLRGHSWWLRDVRAPAPYRAALALRGDAPFAVRVHGFLDLARPGTAVRRVP
ncbi:hypothetical protein [Streptomyces sp. W4I9-2]|uniref:hypothetical protein n=1 Tax=Streptomyces sp. W4I9-2 TaxID=3042297 RepID=UPI00278A0F00|nr:hypothetical protein [Streptomyces sp. W4I9-2]MDQ0695237.1 hypothetical protein [Streptomyces sp. W4I9-2]